jgi:FixJ family two-component response regulator
MSNRVVAVIDDSAATLDATKDLLSAFGYEAELYGSAEDFYAAAATTQATCLIVDIQLGASSGIDLVRRLAEAGLKFPTIFMTGSRDESLRKEAEEAGCIRFLRKPFFPKELIEALDRAMR